MGRTHNIGRLHYNAFDWSEDALVVLFATTKTDKKGERAEETAKHIYANPLQPQICAILALAVYVFTNTFHKDGFLFESNNAAKKRFFRTFKTLIETLSVVVPNLKAVLSDIASHSNRKVHYNYRDF
jgi:hypothetical protein